MRKRNHYPRNMPKQAKLSGSRGNPFCWMRGRKTRRKQLQSLWKTLSVPREEANMVLKVCQRLKPDDPALFVTFGDVHRIHQALSQPGPGRPCPPGADANASYDALKQWVMDKIPTGARTAAVLVSGAANAVAFGNLSEAEFNEISTQITFLPNNFAWVAAIRANGLSCGLVLQGDRYWGGSCYSCQACHSTIFF